MIFLSSIEALLQKMLYIFTILLWTYIKHEN